MAHYNKFDNYLQSTLRQMSYSQPDVVRKDINNMTMHFKDLSPSTETYVFNNGVQKKLIQIKGTIPVCYRGNTYNIPVIIWILEDHPKIAPICFVNPTSNMLVRAGKHVDNSGKIYLPYLNEWRYGSHDLTSLIQVMAVVFGEQTPVYAKQQAPVRPEPPPVPNRSPYPPGLGVGGRMPYPVTTPYPTTEGPPTSSYQQRLPYPNPQPTQNTPYPATNNYPNTGPGYPVYPSNPQQGGYSPSMPAPIPPKAQSSIGDETIKASLKSAVNDKLKRRMKDAFAQAESEMTTLKQTENELKSGQAKINKIIEKLEQETLDVEKNITILEERNQQIDEKLESLNDQQENLNIDEIVAPTTPLYKQIVQSFAQEQAIEDAIYYLGEALRKDVLDLDVFLKHVRSLAREQFMLRAIIKTAREKAGLAEI